MKKKGLKNLLRGLLLSTCIVFLTPAAGAFIGDVTADTGSIAGTVFDAGTGGALSGASCSAGGKSVVSGAGGSFRIDGLAVGSYTVTCSKKGYSTGTQRDVKVAKGGVTNVAFKLSPTKVTAEKDAEKVKPAKLEEAREMKVKSGKSTGYGRASAMPSSAIGWGGGGMMPGDSFVDHNTESYNVINENAFMSALQNPLSTFSIDVDTASYANTRRFIVQQSQLPPKDAVRVEEFINYFTYDYPEPKGEDPFSVNTEISTCPWNSEHRLVLIGLQGKKIDMEKAPPSNIVFLIDVSGSMNSPNKLPLVKSSMKLLLGAMRPTDRIAMTVYAGAAGLVLPSTPVSEGDKIMAALDSLSAGGSTAGGAGIKLAYKVAADNFIRGGNNRVIICTDGDFNVGASSDAEMVRLIEEKRKEGVFLSVLGFGMGNYKDSKMEQLADKGNGNYAYIDSILEARKVLVSQIGGTLYTIAKDVKIQVEFNPAKVKGYRLVGYENRLLAKEDFDDDKKDAGELGSGHTVTVLYEIVPAGSKEEVPGAGDLKYQETKISPEAFKSPELMTVKLRYKKPDGDTSKLIQQPLVDKDTAVNRTSDNFRFAAAVAQFGLLLRDSKFKGNATWPSVKELAKGAQGKDAEGYRSEFLKLVEQAELLSGTR